MEDRREKPPKSERGSETVGIDQLDPADLKKTLPGWKSSEIRSGMDILHPEGKPDGYEFKRTIGGVIWTLLINQKRRLVALTPNRHDQRNVKLGDVDRVKCDQQTGSISFLAGRDGEYRISDKGLSHTPDFPWRERQKPFRLDRE